jgi:hypothetical protein
VFLALLMTGAFLGIVSWTSNPGTLEKQYDRIAKPIADHFAEQRAAAWQAARKVALQQWMAHAKLPADCRNPTSSLRALECKNQLEMQTRAFEEDWNNKIASGWRPEGIN